MIFEAKSTILQPVEFMVFSDSLANEMDETFTLRLQFDFDDENAFISTDDLSANEVIVTIIDDDSMFIACILFS